MKHIRILGLVLLIGFTLSVVGCAVSERTPENKATLTPMPRVVTTRMAALYIGPLTMVDGCLRIGDSEAGNLVVWPPDFEVSIENDTIWVLYDDHKVEVRLGQVVRLGGGEVKSIARPLTSAHGGKSQLAVQARIGWSAASVQSRRQASSAPSGHSSR
jgi:hypothetical protein